MLLAQALGEYAALGALIEGFNNASLRVEEVAGEWGTEGLLILVAAGLIWKVITVVR